MSQIVIQLYVPVAATRAIAGRGDSCGLESLWTAYRELIAVETLTDSFKTQATVNSSSSPEFVEVVLKRLEEVAVGAALDTPSLASRIAHDTGYMESSVKTRLIRLAHERPDLATQDGPEYRMYGKVLRAWRWHGRKPE